MKTVWIAAAVTVVLGLLAAAGGAAAAVALGRPSTVALQAPSANGTSPRTPGMGPGMRFGGRIPGFGPMGGMLGLDLRGSGPVHDAVVAALAKGLGLTVDELNAQLNNGQSLGAIAQQKGLTSEQYCSLIGDARKAAISAAVTAGEITQSQADQMMQALGQERCPAGFGGRFAYPNQ